jgi:hypothetical protein
VQDATLVTTPELELTLIKSRTPHVYVPRRFRIGGLADIRHGAAIVGTPQGDGMVAIDVESTSYVDPTPEIWARWVSEAARRHSCADEEELLPGETMETQLVSEHDLIEVGLCEGGQVVVTNEVGGARLSVWIEAGRAAFATDGNFLHET